MKRAIYASAFLIILAIAAFCTTAISQTILRNQEERVSSYERIQINGVWYNPREIPLNEDPVYLALGGSRACGSWSGGGFPSIADIVAGLNYLYYDGSPPMSFDEADCDDHELYTLSDLAWLLRSAFGDGPPPICPPSQPPLDGPVNDSIYLHTFETSYPAAEIFPPGQDELAVHFHLTTDTAINVASLAFSMRVGTEIPTIDSVTLPESDMASFMYLKKVDHDRGVVDIGLISVSSSNDILPGTYEYGYVHLSVPPMDEVWRPIIIEWDSLTPIQDEHYVHYPYVTGVNADECWTPTVFRFPCIGERRGNVNYDEDDELDISDLVFLVNYMFKEGPPPKCFEEADVDESIGLDVADLVYIVNYMFKDGPAPEMCPQE